MKTGANEIRSIDADLKIEKRALNDGVSTVIVGYASVFNRESENLGGFVEIIEPGAFRDAIMKDDVRALFNHDDNLVLGRVKSRTLEMSEDELGLRVSIVPPETTYARDLMAVMARGDVSQMSFAFTLDREDQEWTEDKTRGLYVRKIKRIRRLYDVSVVTNPAYPDTTVAASQLRSLKEISNKIVLPVSLVRMASLKTALW